MDSIRSLIAEALPAGWGRVFQVYEQNAARQDPAKLPLFTDLYFAECLRIAGQRTPDGSIWLLSTQWYSHRSLPANGYDLPAGEAERIAQLQQLIRREFDRTFATPGGALPGLDEPTARRAINMWRDVFLSSQSALNQQPHSPLGWPEPVMPGTSEQPAAAAHEYLRLSLHFPFAAERFPVNSAIVLLAADVPVYAKVLLSMWLMNIPRYNATQYHRQRIAEQLPVLVRCSRTRPNWMDPFFHVLVEWWMVSMFRLAYIHEDNAELTKLFGEFVSSQMHRLLPQYCAPMPPPERPANLPRKIRIGYLSHRFSANAVTFYMANRLIRHDRNTFEVHVFALGPRQDDMTDVLRRHCDRFVRLENALDYHKIAQTVRDSRLDVLIFADIGMEIHSYLLAGMRLAPVQAALLGHASPTGLPTMDYFFSSEVEPDHAQTQYREKLVRLPGPGADQILPPGLRNGGDGGFTREQLGIPADAFVMVSCANGMKHVPERDFLWTEILRRIPNAWILLKPFSPGDRDSRLQERIHQAGRLAGAPERIRCIEGLSRQQDLFSLLALADLQLDTYPFNGWTTTIEAFCVALPTVTQEGQGYRSRIGAAFLRSMGIREGIAANEVQYIEWAERFAKDPALCRWVRNRIQATRQPLLFENTAVQMAFENHLIAMVREREGEAR